ncbi:MAG: hypothetical protein H0V81_14495 [Solirubrobacterales bacterium]|nr:hypothetical protein [Solirubrobacterales bacterium]
MTRATRHALAVVTVLVALAAGLWFWSGVVAPGYRSSIALGVLWCVLVVVLAGRVGGRLPELKRTLRATTTAAVVVLLAGTYWTSIRETEVNEVVEVGAPASSLSEEELAEEAGVAPGVDPLAPPP